MRGALARLIRDRRGATAIEYGLILGLIALTAVVGVAGLGGKVSTMWSNSAGRVTAVSPLP